ncbi:fucose permease [Labedella gwakjiensis]|uniref:Fucose permease n=1 Tax=Labedella gwakjiensis TaxID=390269 RepID=A0A2P8GVP6_9MICO|nr:MFS transporter [Labedella gwakjiensis]PSL38040.1 fucose permease [Labedella gwakjiensis]RUQ87399.1 MFS transporter [Labedella gwakjiensis]
MTSSPLQSRTLSRREIVAWRNAVFVMFALSGLSIATWVARLPAIRDALGLTTGNVGVLIFGMSAGSIIGLLLSAWILGRIGPRRGMAASIVLVAIGLIVVGLGAGVFVSAPVVFVGLAIFGYGNGSVDVMMNVEGAAVEKELGKTVLPLMHALFSAGTVLGAGIGAAASALKISVTAHAVGMAVVIAVAAIIAVRFVPIRPDLHAIPDAEQPPLRERLREKVAVFADPRLIFIGLIMLGMAFAEGSANDWLPIAVVDGHDQSNTTGAIVFGVFVGAMTVGRVAGGPLIDRFDRVSVLRISAATGIVGLALFIFSPIFPLAIVGAVLWGLGCSLGFPVGMSAAADDPRHAAARVSAVAMIGYCAFLVGPPLIGIVGDHVGILNALLIVFVLMIVAGLSSGAARERSEAARSGG